MQSQKRSVGHSSSPRFRRWDKFRTNEAEGGTPLAFVIKDIYEDGKYGGSLVEAADTNCVNVRWIEEISTEAMDLNGWELIEGPSLDPNDAGL